MKAALIALASVLLPVPVAPAIPETVVIDPASIVQVICPTDDGYKAGTAFRVGNDLMLSVNHVTSGGDCFINGQRVVVRYASEDEDFSMLEGSPGPSLKIDCGGFVRGRRYIAIGFARGLPTETSVELYGTGMSDDGLALLTGMFTVIPGQSGGPVIDAETGKVVGTVNTDDFQQGISGSVELRGTPVCRKIA
jgi:hypothetical protein